MAARHGPLLAALVEMLPWSGKEYTLEAAAPAPPSMKPVCPRCGWSNTRPSHTRTTI